MAKDVDNLLRRIAEGERKLGHKLVADDLERILKESPAAHSPGPPVLTGMPVSRRDSAPLLKEIPHDELRHNMVLPTAVERRFERIEREFAARSRLASHGLRPRQRILLYGPPGCGKTLGAERLAWTTGLPLKKVQFDTLLSSFFGETLANLRRIFDDTAQKPCALLLDECDTLARARSERNDIGEINRITNALLELLEDYRGDGLIIAATNLDSALDPALFRRFDEVLKIPLPGHTEVLRLLKLTLSSIRTETSINWDELAQQVDGMSCSEVAQIARNAAKSSILCGNDRVGTEDVRHALEESLERGHN
ncbi:MAG: ATP-binding protein [Opitutaceae bacterium]|jgi:SpoVK/Ycf46/Vps4 family AAA+-type ATPase